MSTKSGVLGGDYFTIAAVTAPYDFEVLTKWNDLGHFIEVDKNKLVTYAFNANADARQIAAKIRNRLPYWKAISRIGNGNAYLQRGIDRLT